MRFSYGLVGAMVVTMAMGAGCSLFSKTNVSPTPSVQGSTDSVMGDTVATTTPDGKGKLPGATSTPVAKPTPPPTPAPVPVPTPTPAPKPSAPSRVEIQMSENGFTPSEVKIAKGGTVVFKNVGTQAVWPASSKHPAHLDYPPFDPKKGIAPGASYEISFPEVKTYFFHDHIIASHFGKVIVE